MVAHLFSIFQARFCLNISSLLEEINITADLQSRMAPAPWLFKITMAQTLRKLWRHSLSLIFRNPESKGMTIPYVAHKHKNSTLK